MQTASTNQAGSFGVGLALQHGSPNGLRSRTSRCSLSPAEEVARGCTGPVPVNAIFDPANCGGCGVACTADEACSSGTCVRGVTDAGSDVADAGTE